MERALNTQPNQSSLLTLWGQQRNAILQLGQALHERIPTGEPEVTVHGRDLEAESEGVGFQFQLTMNGALYDDRFRAGYFVVQVQLIKRKAGLGWRIDAMPILEVEHANYDLYAERSQEFAYRDRQGIETFLLEGLARDAGVFFENARNGVRPDEAAVPHGGDRTAPLL